MVLSILAMTIAWIWWVAFIISVAALVLFQVLWCCRQRKVGMVATQIVCFLAASAHIGAGIWALVRWRNASDCYPFVFDTDDYEPIDRGYYRETIYNDYGDPISYYTPHVDNGWDYCAEKAWAIITLLDAILWLAAGGCLVAFVKTGRHARWEANLTERYTTTTATNLELGTAVPVGKVDNVA